jgi:5-hydroxyisourate hydrolase
MPGFLTTHVLDTASGRPAANLELQLFRLDPSGDGRELLKEVQTNADGRTDAPLLDEGELESGAYEIVFSVGDYFAQNTDVPDPPFLGTVPVRFGVADPSSHYHVPLLVSPWAYSTYRGS